MPDYTYGAAPVLVETTGDFAFGATGTLLAPDGNAATVYDLNGSPIAGVKVGPKGAHQGFMADIPNGMLDFGSVRIIAVSIESMTAAISAHQAAEAAAASAETAAQAAVGKADADHTHANTGGTTVTVDGQEVQLLEIDSTPITAEDLGIEGGSGVAPAVVVPPSSTLAPVGAVAWPAVNYSHFSRFTLPGARTYRYFNIGVDSATGNIQVGVVKLAGTGLRSFTRVATSGVIPASNGSLHIDMGTFNLEPGDYALFAWADNTTIRMKLGGHSAATDSRLTGAQGYSGGVPASGTISTWGAYNYLSGISLEVP